MTAKEIMTQPVITALEDTPLEQIARLMLDHKIGGVPIVSREGCICGIVTESDFTQKEQYVPFSLFRAPKLFGEWVSPARLEKAYETARTLPARDVMTRSVATVEEDDSLQLVITNMIEKDVNRIPVVRQGKPVGIVARRDLLKIMVRR